MSTNYIIGGVGNVNPAIEWQEGAVCFADGEQWLANSTDGDKRYQLQNFGGDRLYSFYGITNHAKDFQLNTIKQGDYIEASELDTEQKYNDVVEVFKLCGADFGFDSCFEYSDLDDDNILIWSSELNQAAEWHVGKKRKLTYSQIMAIGELKKAYNRQHIEDDFIDRFGFGVISRSEEKMGNFQPYDIGSESFKSAIDKVKEQLESEDVVNKPSHYQFFDGVEVIEIIASSMTREQFKGYCLGNRIKYRLRAGNKDELEQEIAKSDKYVELYDEHKHLCKK